jgi:hypothetical protein
VANLVTPPPALLKPSVAWRVLLGNLKGPAEPAPAPLRARPF